MDQPTPGGRDRAARWRRGLAPLLVALLAAGAAAGQDQPVGPPVLEFSFSNPGARSLGFGGAFVALADDATAAFSNPSGLVQLLRPEVSVEGRGWSFSTPYTESGRVEGEPSGIGIDTRAGLRTARSSDEAAALAFLSFVYPTSWGSLALYRHQLASFESSSETNGLFGGEAGPAARRFLDRRATIDIDVVSYGVAAAYRVTETLSLGAGLAYFDAAMLLTTATFRPDDDSEAARFAASSYLAERGFARTAITLDDADWGLNAGFLWSLSDRWRLGGVYRQGPALRANAAVFAGPALGAPIPPGALIARRASPFLIPDVYGLGIAYRSPAGALTASFEWDRVLHSSVIDGLNPEIAPVDDLELDDADELHLGIEYVFLRSSPLTAVRLGVWLDPDHRLRYRGDDPYSAALLRPGDDEIHFAAGFGLAFESFQIDVGADFSDLRDTVSISAIYSF